MITEKAYKTGPRHCVWRQINSSVGSGGSTMTVGQTVQSPMAIYCLTTTCHTIVMPHGALGTITCKPPLLSSNAIA